VEPARSSSSDLTSTLLAAFAWAAVDTARTHHELPVVSVFVALFGSASLVLGMLVVATRRALPLGAVARAFVSGALIAALPLTLIAAVLQKTTHHRALGGVTFAFVALFVSFACVACARRLSELGRGALLVVATLSSAGALIALALGLRAVTAAPFVAVVLDAVLGVASCALALSLRRLPRGVLRFATMAWAGVVAVGIFVAVSSAPLRHALSERAPMAFAIGWALGG
jgi:hypothetical protein